MIRRQIEAQIIQSMKDFPSVTVYGPRQCGKTTTVKKLFPDFSYANLEDISVRRLAADDPAGFFARFPEPVIIDEIQRVPELLSMVQVRIDRYRKKVSTFSQAASRFHCMKQFHSLLPEEQQCSTCSPCRLWSWEGKI